MKYPSLTAMWKDALFFLAEKGETVQSRNGGSRELIGWSGTIVNSMNNWVVCPRRAPSVAYGCAELLWYLSGEPEVRRLLPYAPQYVYFAEANGAAFGAYGFRMGMYSSNNSLSHVVELLKKQPTSRQAVVSLWHPTDLKHAVVGEKKDLPCTLSLQFILRYNVLHLITTMRSNDVWLGMPYDVFCFTMIQRLVAGELGAECGSYTHNVGSLHLYDKHAKAASEVPIGNGMNYDHDWGRPSESLADVINSVINWHAVQDRRSVRTEVTSRSLYDVVACVETFHDEENAVKIGSPLLRKGYENYVDFRRARLSRQNDSGEASGAD